MNQFMTKSHLSRWASDLFRQNLNQSLKVWFGFSSLKESHVHLSTVTENSGKYKSYQKAKFSTKRFYASPIPQFNNWGYFAMMSLFPFSFFSKSDEEKEEKKTIVIIVGAGLAGCCAAIEAVNNGADEVIIIDKAQKIGGNSSKASSGINGVMTKAQIVRGIKDSVEKFVNDTIKSGKGKSNQSLVNVLVSESTDAVSFLEDFGIDLSILSKCGGHSECRTHRNKVPETGFAVNVGYHIMSNLQKVLMEDTKFKSKVKIMTNTIATDLITEKSNDGLVQVKGVKIQDVSTNVASSIEGSAVIISTGGFAANRDLLKKATNCEFVANLATSNHAGTTGDGITMVTRNIPNAGVVDMSEVQIHPTCLVHPQNMFAKSLFLGAEALRGHGGILINRSGSRFVNELSTRDEVTGAIFRNCRPEADQGPTIAYLIMNEKGASEFGEKLFSFYQSKGFVQKYRDSTELCQSVGIDCSMLAQTLREYGRATQDPFGKSEFPTLFTPSESLYLVRTTPCLHYCMGGLKFNEKAQVITDDGNPIRGLFAAGEVTGGLHGRNRLAGNSLLECVVFGRIAGKYSIKQ